MVKKKSKGEKDDNAPEKIKRKLSQVALKTAKRKYKRDDLEQKMSLRFCTLDERSEY